MKRYSAILGCLVLLLGAIQTSAQIKYQGPAKKSRVLFLLDCSGSMLAPWENNETRIVAAKRVLSKYIDSLKVNKNLELAFRVYGHQFERKLNNCEDTKLEVPFAPGNHAAIIAKLNGLSPKGTTPISYSLLQAAKDFPQDPTFRNVVIVITDGLESCNRDPCAVSIELQKKHIFLKPFIIGLGPFQDYGNAFDCMGQYFNASNTTEFTKALDKAMNQSLGKTTISVNLLDVNDLPKETNVNMTFLNRVTGEVVYDFVHFLNAKGQPDTLSIDPVISYDIKINTLPAVVKENVYLEGGRHNIVNVKCPQGNLVAQFPTPVTEYKNPQMVVKPLGKNQTLISQKIGLIHRYLVGQYDVEIMTLPRIQKTVTIRQSETTRISIPSPGLLSIANDMEGFGSIYVQKDNGEFEWIYNFENDIAKTNLPLQPGKYKVVFRAKKAVSSKLTDVQYFQIVSGKSTNLTLFVK